MSSQFPQKLSLSQNDILALVKIKQSNKSSQGQDVLDQKIVFPLAKLKHFRSGSDHVLFTCEVPSMKNKVLIFNQVKKSAKIQGKHQDLQKQLEEKYNQILLQIPQIRSLIPKKQPYEINIGQGLIIDLIFAHLTSLCVNGEKIAPETKVIVAQNILNEEKYESIIEFKPKTPLPDVYSIETIKKMSQKFNLSPNQIRDLLKNRSQIQKTRWYKKKLFSRLHKDKVQTSQIDTTKQNQNPFHIFYLQQLDNTTPKYSKTKLYKHFPPQLSFQHQDSLNLAIYQKMKEENIQKVIYKMQSVYLRPVPIAAYQCLSQIEKEIQTFHIFLSSVIKQKLLEPEAPTLASLQSFLQSYNCVQNQNEKQWNEEQCNEKEVQLTRVLKYLISLTWRDVSVVCCLTKSREIKFYVIDTQLKKIEKIEENLVKDEQFLSAYLSSILEEHKAL